MKTCGDCHWFEGDYPHPNSPKTMEGFCYRFPPQMLPGPDENFPKTDAHSAMTRVHSAMRECGEFRQADCEEEADYEA